MTSVRNGNGRLPWPRAAANVARGSILTVVDHWALALFSLAAAFAVWFVIQDVENPRVTATFPAEGPATIPIGYVNDEAAIPNQQRFVSVDVEGREDDLAALSADDFEVTIDLKGVPINTPIQLPVKAASTRDGVRVLAVRPSTVEVILEPLTEQTFRVSLNTSGQLQAGLQATPEIEPIEVTVRGLEAQLRNVVSVDLDVNLNALRDGANVVEGDLRARSATGAQVEVSVAPARAKVTYTVVQTFVQRSLPVIPVVTGTLAPGYRFGNMVVEPPFLTASGPRSRMDGITQLGTASINVTGATADIVLTRNVELPENVTVGDRRQVTVRIEVRPIECGGATNTACGYVSVQLAPGFENSPAGQFVQGTVSVVVRLSGPLAELQKLDPRSIAATVNLATPVSPGQYPVTITVPPALTSAGIRAEQPSPIPVSLGPTP